MKNSTSDQDRKQKGLFITFEGIEGSGKTTQMRLFDAHLRKKGYEVHSTREPGGTPIGDQIRKILLRSGNSEMHPLTEMFLLAANRAQHIHDVILPVLSRGAVVLCDRYTDSSLAYQAYARGISTDTVLFMNKIATQNKKPDLTILIDIPAESSLSRARTRNVQLSLINVEDRFEQENEDFHRAVREGYLRMAEEEPGRFLLIDGKNSIEGVHEELLQRFESLGILERYNLKNELNPRKPTKNKSSWNQGT